MSNEGEPLRPPISRAVESWKYSVAALVAGSVGLLVSGELPLVRLPAVLLLVAGSGGSFVHMAIVASQRKPAAIKFARANFFLARQAKRLSEGERGILRRLMSGGTPDAYLTASDPSVARLERRGWISALDSTASETRRLYRVRGRVWTALRKSPHLLSSDGHD